MKNQPHEVCRMPWFLVEVKRNETSLNLCEYFIVHSVDINEIQSSNMYVDGSVTFDHNQQSIKGTLRFASEDRAIIEYEMQKLINKHEYDKQRGKFFIVQYSNTNRDIVHAIIPESDLVWPNGVQDNAGEVLVKIAKNYRRASVILCHEDGKQIKSEFEKIKNWCSENSLSKSITMASHVSSDNWILVQYCKLPTETEVVYSVLNERETHWSDENLYKDVVAYIQEGETIYQALILAKSKDLQHLIKELVRIKEFIAFSSIVEMKNVENQNLRYMALAPSYSQYSDRIIPN